MKVATSPTGKKRFVCGCGLSHGSVIAAEGHCATVIPMPAPIPPGHRTPEEITAQIEARYAEMEREAASTRMTRPCETCAHRDPFHDHRCNNPLVRGFGKEGLPTVDWQIKEGMWPASNWPPVQICGIEKALWEPKPELPRKLNWLRRAWEWVRDNW